MCDSCEEDRNPTRVFKAVRVISKPVDPKAVVLYGRTLNLCFPCYRIAVRSYHAATVALPTARESGAGPKPPETIKAV